MPRNRLLPTSTLLVAIACGPPRVGSDADDDEPSSGESTAGGTESSSTDGGEPTTTSEGPTFIPDEDYPTVTECDPFMQDCPEGEKCVPYGSTGGNWDAFKCVPVLGDNAVGEPCIYGGVAEATDDCDATSHCWDVMEVGGLPVGICHPICLGSADDPECPPGYSCLISGDGSIALCVGGCDPLVQDCGTGLACFWANGNFNCIFTTENIPAGQPCRFINDCAPGLACLAAETLPSCEGASCCSGFCDLELGDGPCEALVPGTACVAFFEEGMAPPSYETVGLCVLPL